MKKVALFAFNGEPLCFVHVLLNGMDLKNRGYEVKIIIEGQATKVVPELAREGALFGPLYEKARSAGIIDGACKACSAKMGVAEAIRAEHLPLLDEMGGHPSMGRYLENGYEVITF